MAARTREWLGEGCERGILGLVLALLAFGPLATGAVRTVEFLVLQALTMGVVLLWMVRLWLVRGTRLLWPPIAWAVLGFVVLAVVRYQQAPIEYVARKEMIRVLVYALLFFVILNNLNRQEPTQLIAYGLALLGMAMSVYAIYQFATNSPHVWHFLKPANYAHRGTGTYINPNHLAGFLEVVLPLALAYTLAGRMSPLVRILLGYSCLVMAAGLTVTLSRAGWLSAAVGVALVLTVLVRQRQYRLPAILALVLLCLLGTTFFTRSFITQKRWDRVHRVGADDDAGGRLLLWQPAVQMWRDHFWWGVGPGHFDQRFPAYRPLWVQARPAYAHNDYLNTLADWGVAGAALVAGAWVLLAWGVVRTWRFVRREDNSLRAKHSQRFAFVCGAAGGLAALLVHSFFDFNMQIPANAILVVTLMALLSGHLRFATERYWVGSGVGVRVFVTLACLGGVAYLGQQGWRRAQEHRFLARADREKQYTPACFAALQRAAELEPMNFETAYTLGEGLRRVGWDGLAGSEEQIREAIAWFQRAATLNPFDPYNPMRIGMCLDWQKKHAEALRHFERALALDPRNYYVIDHLGWHYVQVEDYETAKKWFRRSMETPFSDRNPIAWIYLDIIRRREEEKRNAR
jgi:O-antigen ligase